jgi:hypothetical protein
MPRRGHPGPRMTPCLSATSSSPVYLHPGGTWHTRPAGAHRHLPRPPGRPCDRPRTPARRGSRHPQRWGATARADVERLLASPSLSPRMSVSGHVYEIPTGHVTTIQDARYPWRPPAPPASLPALRDQTSPHRVPGAPGAPGQASLSPVTVCSGAGSGRRDSGRRMPSGNPIRPWANMRRWAMRQPVGVRSKLST